MLQRIDQIRFQRFLILYPECSTYIHYTTVKMSLPTWHNCTAVQELQLVLSHSKHIHTRIVSSFQKECILVDFRDFQRFQISPGRFSLTARLETVVNLFLGRVQVPYRTHTAKNRIVRIVNDCTSEKVITMNQRCVTKAAQKCVVHYGSFYAGFTSLNCLGVSTANLHTSRPNRTPPFLDTPLPRSYRRTRPDDSIMAIVLYSCTITARVQHCIAVCWF